MSNRIRQPTWSTLRKGVRFHDGHELTAADVVHTFRTILDPASRSPHRGAFRGLQSVDARDPYTVVFTLSEPFSSFPINLVIPQIIPAGAGPDLANHPIGTGPYRFVRQTPDDFVELAAFDGYWAGDVRERRRRPARRSRRGDARPGAPERDDRSGRSTTSRPTSSISSAARSSSRRRRLLAWITSTSAST